MDDKILEILERLASFEARLFTPEEKTEVLVGIKRIPELDKNCEKRTQKLENRHKEDINEIKVKQEKNSETIQKNKLSIVKIIAWATGAGSGAGLLISFVFKLIM